MANGKKVIRKAKKGRLIRQVAAIPFRRTDAGTLEVMLVTSRESHRFIIPKGWPMKGKNDREAASTEAREEAGVLGRPLRRPIGKFRYWKRIARRFVPVEVTVFMLKVENEDADWKEAGMRERAWLSPAEAMTLIDQPELVSLIQSLAAAQPA
jgi:8-oxo-dGTP pyrophosphatase MutT (NUDIX family)